MPIDCVVAKVCFAAHKPLRERRLTEITNFLERFVPVNRCGLFGPETLRLLQGLSTEFKRPDWLAHGGTISSGVAEMFGCAVAFVSVNKSAAFDGQIKPVRGQSQPL